MRFITDRSGFPMIWIENLNAYLHYFPVTKVQVERFLCQTDDSRYDGEWYDELLRLNTRTSTVSIKEKTLFGVWATGLLPAEAEDFCEWSGNGMRLPTHEEWRTAYQSLKKLPVQKVDWQKVQSGIQSRTLHLLNQLPLGEPANMAEQMYLRNGVFEWVSLSGKNERWGGMGCVPISIYSHTYNLDQGLHHAVRAPEVSRRFYYGFRALVPAS